MYRQACWRSQFIPHFHGKCYTRWACSPAPDLQPRFLELTLDNLPLLTPLQQPKLLVLLSRPHLPTPVPLLLLFHLPETHFFSLCSNMARQSILQHPIPKDTTLLLLSLSPQNLHPSGTLYITRLLICRLGRQFQKEALCSLLTALSVIFWV